MSDLVSLSKTRPDVQPTDMMSEAGRKVLAFHFGRMLKEIPEVLHGRNPDAIHDMRVATRRMRSALRLFKPFYRRDAIRSFRDELRQIATALGAVRDLDVFRLKTEAYAASLSTRKRSAVRAYLRTLNQQEEAARAALLQLLNSHEFKTFVIAYAEFVQTPGQEARHIPQYDEEGCPVQRTVRDLAPALIYSQHGRLRAYEAILDSADLDTLHRLRIEAKRLRYMLETFSAVLGDEVKVAIEAAKALQDHLGELQDARVANTMLSGYLTEADGVVQTARRDGHYRVVREYMAVRRAEETRLQAAVGSTWGSFNDAEVRRALAISISVL